MKKLYVIVFFMTFSLLATAKDKADKQYYGVFAGANMSKSLSFPTSMDSVYGGYENFGAGCQIGGFYEIALSQKRTWFFHTGLNLNYYNSKGKDVKETGSYFEKEITSDYKLSSLFAELPVMFVRKIKIKDWCINPSLGLSYNYGITGKIKSTTIRKEHKGWNTYDTEKYTKNENIFDAGMGRDAVFNLRAELGASYKHYLLTGFVAYPLSDIFSFGLSFGYQF